MSRNRDTILEKDGILPSPIVDSDWDSPYRRNKDPEVLFFQEGDDVDSYSEEETGLVHRGVRQSAARGRLRARRRPRRASRTTGGTCRQVLDSIPDVDTVNRKRR